MWQSSQSRAVVAYAPQSSSTEELAALVVPAALGFLDDAPPRRPSFLRAPRSSATEQLAALVAATSLGLPWDSSQSLARFSSAPRPETVDVLLALVPGAPEPEPGEPGPWLDSPAVFSRYTIITPAQEDAAELGALVPSAVFVAASPWRTAVARRRSRTAVAKPRSDS